MLRKWRNHQRQTNPKSKLLRYIKLALLVVAILVWGVTLEMTNKRPVKRFKRKEIVSKKTYWKRGQN